MRHLRWAASTVILCFALGSPLLARGTPPASVVELERWHASLFNQIAPSVVLVSNAEGFGSGFFIAPGIILTNAHVVGAAQRVRVVLRDGRKPEGVVIERASDDGDLALVQVPITDVLPLPVNEADGLRVGDFVGAVGHGKGAVWSLNTGMVSNIYRAGNQRPVFQTQIPLNPGSSGGPVFDSDGKVVGVVTAGITSANAINFAIKIDVAFQKLKRLAHHRLTLRISLPTGIPVLVDGTMVGVGPELSIPCQRGEHEVSAVISGKLVRRTARCGQGQVAVTLPAQ